MHPATMLTGRQYGLDWLRIEAFALLILFHIGMFFVPWGWHVKAAAPVERAVWPMMAINPWRLMLLFVISGVVSRSQKAWATILEHWRELLGLAGIACAALFTVHGLSDAALVWETARAWARAALA
jgi:hypothetical protein